jgi:EAL domain-containing protein (putative c-di-GMP-specific phosphodiesterase class I)
VAAVPSLRSVSPVDELRRAIEARELLVHYQPKADMATASVVGVEALVRWEHPSLGLILPAHFVPLAERNGLIPQLTELVVDTALGQCRAWLGSGLRMPVAVNISAGDLLDNSFPSLIAALLYKWAVLPEMLELEVTEHSMTADPPAARECLLRLTELGVALSTADFGPGYPSLDFIKGLPLQELKISPAFTTRLNDDAASGLVVHAILALGKSLGLRVTAVGVEDQDVWRQLARLGCDCGQGSFLARPMPGIELAGWHEAWRSGRNVDAMAGPSRVLRQ